MVTKPELGEGGDELAAPYAVVFLLVVEGDEHVIADAESLELGVWRV